MALIDPRPPPDRHSEAERPRFYGPKPVTVLLVVLHLGLLLVGGLLLASDLDPGPRTRTTGSEVRAACASADDGHHSLLDLARRPSRAKALAQLHRWELCDRSTRERAKGALRRDWLLVGVIFSALTLGVVRGFQRRRWRAAACFTAVLAVIYLVADLLENLWLGNLLEREAWTENLRWATAVKTGALVGSAPIFIVSMAGVLGELVAEISPDPRQVARDPSKRGVRVDRAPKPSAAATKDACKSFARRWIERLLGGRPEPEAAEEAEPEAQAPAGLGVSCSGGGIRSAAFNLGALQALDGPGGELSRAEHLAAVSGGAYLATAWVTARSPDAERPRPMAWSRLSADEVHLRRNSDYLAPGLTGKLWALLRFVFGFLVNIGLIALFLGVIFVPAGRLIDSYSRAQRTGEGGSISLPDGGCLQLPDASTATLLPGAKLLLATSGPARLAGDVPPNPDGSGGKPPAGLECQPRPGAAKATDELPAAAPGRVLKKGTRVTLRLDRPLEVRGAGVPGCDGPPPCPAAQARVVALRRGTRLMSAPVAVLTLPATAVVDAGGALDSACGSRPCHRFRQPAIVSWAFFLALGSTVLTGVALVIARATPATAKGTVWAAKVSAFFAAAVGIAGYGFPKAAVWAENGGWLLQGKAVQTGGAGTAAVLVALAAQLRPFLGGIDSAKGEHGPLVSGLKRIAARFRPLLIRLAGLVVGPVAVVVVAVAFASYAARQSGGENRPGQLGLWLALVGPLMVLLLGGDLNEWSVHPYYRDQLRSAFAIDPLVSPPEDPREDPLERLPEAGPQLMICAAANLADARATALGRPVVSWTFSRGRMGSVALERPWGKDTGSATGFLTPAELPSRLKHLGWAWTAVAVSGAMFSPAMGKVTRPERFLMVLGNLRMGVWYPNPRWFDADREWYDKHSPRPWYLAKEALGLHKIHDRWLYLTDGGHYENLGLVELLRAGCRQIYCFDAAGDAPETFGTLADGVRLAREELGIEVSINPAAMCADKSGMSKIGVQAGTVCWPGEDSPSGWLVVAKLSVPATAPFDIIDLARTLPSFPTHPTADQLYTDQKFEAYRALGHHLGAQAAKLGTRINVLTHQGRSLHQAVAEANAELAAEG